jgi:crossover junction endodeoxyribonuclease RuvC
MLKPMRILGVDPGIETVGLGLIEATSVHDIHPVDWLTISTKDGPASDRLLEIHHDFAEFLDEVKPELAVVERLFFAVNRQSAMEVSQARGVLMLALAERGIPILEPTPLQLKSCITGDGKAEKEQVQTMLVKMLNLTSVPTPADAADALALAIYGAIVRPASLGALPRTA